MQKIRAAWKRLLVRTLVIALGITATVVATQAPAQAYVWPPTNCPYQAMCVYEHIGGEGAQYYWTLANTPINTCISIGGWWNDRISSAYNRMPLKTRFYTGAGCGGSQHTFSAACGCTGERSPDLHPWGLGDAFSSWKILPAGS